MITLNKKRFFGIVAIILFLLSVPFIAMQLTAEVNWSFYDFVIMGALLAAAGLGIELTLSNLKTAKSKLVTCGILVLLTLLIWVELAVGVFGTPFAGN